MILGSLLASAVAVHAQAAKATEYQVKAAYLYNFGRFVDWPQGADVNKDGGFTICVLGRDPFGSVLDDTLAKQSVNNQSVAVRRISKSQEATKCRIVFISSSEEDQLREILLALNKSGVLTVSEVPQFAQRGGMIQFVMDGNRVRFEVNLTNAENAGLSLSSELLKVAVAVRRNPPPGV